MYVCVCVYMRVQEPWWGLGVGGAREERVCVLPWMALQKSEEMGKKEKMQEVLAQHVTKTDVHLLTNNVNIKNNIS